MIQDKELWVVESQDNHKYFVCPMKHVLDILKAIISVVGDLHTQNCWLSPIVTFGINTLSKHTHDYCVVEVIIDQN